MVVFWLIRAVTGYNKVLRVACERCVIDGALGICHARNSRGANCSPQRAQFPEPAEILAEKKNTNKQSPDLMTEL